jgi:hypothetical protein
MPDAPAKAGAFVTVSQLRGSGRPSALLPLYWVFERVPPTRDTAARLGLVRHTQMTTALMRAIEDGPCGFRIVGVPEIRGMSVE